MNIIKANTSGVKIRYGKYSGGNLDYPSSLGTATIYYNTCLISYSGFSSPPVVLAVANDTAGGVFSCEVDGAISTTSAYITVYGPSGALAEFFWIAIGV